MSWDGTEGVPRFYRFDEDSASAYVLHHQTSTVLEFQTRDRWRFRGSDEEFKGQSMSISDWGTYMRFGMYKYWRESCQGSRNRAYIRFGVWGSEIEQGEWKCEVKQKHETKWSSETWNVTGNGIQGQMSKWNNHDNGWNRWLDLLKSYSP